MWESRTQSGRVILAVALIAMAAGALGYVSSPIGTEAAQALPKAPAAGSPPFTAVFATSSDIVQVTPEDGTHFRPSLLEIVVATTTGTTTRLLLAYNSYPNYAPSGIYVKSSDDGGETWSASSTVVESSSNREPDLGQAADGTVWLVYVRGCCPYEIYYRTSADGGNTWSAEVALPGGAINLPAEFFQEVRGVDRFNPSVVGTPSGRVIVAYEDRSSYPRTIGYQYLDQGTTTWQGPFALPAVNTNDRYSPDLAVDDSGNVWVVWYGYGSQGWGIYTQMSGDDGVTWSLPSLVRSEGRPPSIASTAGKLMVSWYESDYVSGEIFSYWDYNITYVMSSDGGATWSTPVTYTRFKGYDFNPAVAGLDDGSFALAWDSRRRRTSPEYTQDTTIWFGNIGVHEDVNPPPHINQVEHVPPANPQTGEVVIVVALVVDESSGVAPTVEWSKDGVVQPAAVMFDDGAHGDFAFGDNVFGASLGSFPAGTFVSYSVKATDSDGNFVTSYSRSFNIQPLWVKQSDNLLVLDARNSYAVVEFGPAYESALTNAGVNFDLWDGNILGPPDAAELAQYDGGAVVWAVIEYSGWLVTEFTRDDAMAGIASFQDGANPRS